MSNHDPRFQFRFLFRRVHVHSMSLEVSADISGAPETFLDTEVLQDALEYALADCIPVEIVRVTYESGSRTGDNYLGVIYRIKVHYRRQCNQNGKMEVFSFIAKCTPNTAPNAFLHDCNVFLKEQLCYREVLPRMELLQQGGEKFGARLYHTIKSPLKTLIFEDLQTLQYVMASRESGLDFAHCALVLRKLGKFHAMSMLLEKEDKKLFRSCHSGLISEVMLRDTSMPFHYYAAEIAALEARVRTWSGYEAIADKLERFRQNLRENLMRLVAPQPSDVNVLNHGDLWVNNVLFKYSDTERRVPQDMVFVDFQMSLWGSLGFDLNYFFNTSVQLNTLKLHRLRLVRLYYDSLSVTLATHLTASNKTVKLPTYEQVLHDIEQRESYGFFAAFAIFPMISMDQDLAGDSSLDNLADLDFARKKIELMFASAKVQETLKYSLRRFDELGVFD